MDATLDAAATEPLWLKIPKIADVVARSLLHGAEVEERYTLHAWVVMANHVHVLLCPKVEIARITQGIKGYTARKANEILRRKGSFWQDESFDHWVRNETEFGRIQLYIERNPVAAKLVRQPQDWRWSSAFKGAAKHTG